MGPPCKHLQLNLGWKVKWGHFLDHNDHVFWLMKWKNRSFSHIEITIPRTEDYEQKALIAINGLDVYPEALHLIAFSSCLIQLFGFLFHYGRTTPPVLWPGLLTSELEQDFQGRFLRCLLSSHQNLVCMTSLVVQWLGLQLLTQGVWIRFLLGELSTHMPHGQKTQETKTIL